jgi:subtilisin family serine protease/chitodextrinase
MRTKIFTLFLVFLFSSAALISQERAVNKDGNYKGVIRVKLQDNLVNQLNNLHQKQQNINKITRGKSSYVKTNIEALDNKNSQFNAVEYKRVFRHAGKFEKRHQEFGLHRWYQIEFASEKTVSQFINAYKGVKGVEIAEAVPKMHLSSLNDRKKSKTTKSLSGAPNDSRYDEQWHYNNTGQTGGTEDADIDLPEAWELETGNSEVIVAIEDQGVDVDHPDLAGNMWVNSGETPGNGVDDDNNGYVDDYHGYNFGDDQGAITAGDHGSHTGGTVAAETNNSTGVAGVAGGTGNSDGVRLMSIEVFGSSSQGGFAEGFTYAADMGAHISQNSWGGGGESQSINDAIDYFIANGGSAGSPMEGGVVVFAAGNSNTNSGSSTWPAQYESAIAVAATNHNDVRSYYSNYGTWVDISAPGGETNSVKQEGVLSCIDGSYDHFQGTSMACPHVSGVAALIVSKYAGNITPSEVRSRLINNTDPIDDLNPDYSGQLGSGRLNAYAALTGEAPQPVLSYCASKGNDASYEWISKVEIGTYSNSSDGSGYQDFTSETIELNAGQSYDITLTPGFSNSSYDEYWKIWIDYNNDTSFTSDELVYDAGSLSSSAVTGTINIPSDVSGMKRMRVSMKYNGEQTPCESFDYGEVEDYNVNISSGSGDTEAPTAPTNLASSNITESSVDLTWDASTDNVGVDHYTVFQDGSSIGTTANTSYSVTGLSASTTYTFTVKAEDAAGNVSTASNALDVTTQSDADTEAPTAPTNLASSNITESSVDLTWDASTDNVGVDHYTVFQDGSSIGTTANTSYSVTGLSASTTYTFTVKAEDAAGNVSAASNSLDVTTTDGSVTYCSSQGNNSSYEWISQVDIGSFTNSSNAAGYSDFTGQTVNLTAGASVDITLTPGFSGSSYDEYWKIWIDYNKDGDFSDNGELVFDAGSMSSSAVSGTMNVASDASGTTRMRITMKYNGAPSPCESFSYGEVEDYTVSFGDPVNDTEAPTAPTSLASSNVTESSVDLSWNASTDNVGVDHYTVFQDGSSIGTTANTSYSVTGLSASTTYTFTVKAEDAAGNVSAASNAIDVTTQDVAVSYCESYGQNTNYEWIDLVELGTISNSTSSDGGYADYTNLSTDLTPGTNVTIYFSAGFASSSYTEYWHVWIDFDQNGTFESDEEMVSGSSSSADKLSASFDVPSGATLGQTRMRVTMKYNSAASPCETFSYGEVEDYTVNITSTQNFNVTEFADANAKELKNEKVESNIKIYPNPASNLINLEINAGERNSIVDIYTAEGSLVKSVPINGDYKEISISDLPSGVYILKVPDEREPFIKQFIKK